MRAGEQRVYLYRVNGARQGTERQGRERREGRKENEYRQPTSASDRPLF